MSGCLCRSFWSAFVALNRFWRVQTRRQGSLAPPARDFLSESCIFLPLSARDLSSAILSVLDWPGTGREWSFARLHRIVLLASFLYVPSAALQALIAVR